MVTPDALDALDFLVWLNSGYRAAELCGCHQSSISRRAQETAAVFGLSLIRERTSWRLSGSKVLLDLEREVHQLHRLLRGSQLRLELAPELVVLLPRLATSAWLACCVEAAGPERSRKLLEARVIDGWLTVRSAAPADGHLLLVGHALQWSIPEGTPPAASIPEGVVLVVRRELADHPSWDQLLKVLGAEIDGSHPPADAMALPGHLHGDVLFTARSSAECGSTASRPRGPVHQGSGSSRAGDGKV